MTVLSRIRENMALVVGVIAVSLVVFVLTDFFSGYNRASGGAPNVGTVAGEKVSYKEYNEKYNQMHDNYTKQGRPLSTTDNYSIMDQVWQMLVSDKAYQKEYESLGIGVSGEEMLDMFSGKNISPIVKQQFDQYFKTVVKKEFNGQDVLAFLQQAKDNPEQKEAIHQLEEYLKDTRLKEKYEALVSKAYLSSKAAAKRKVKDTERKSTVSFVGVNYAQIPDSTLKADDSELKAYINSHKAMFKQEEATLIKYVQFDIRPSTADSAKAKAGIAKLKAGFIAAENDSAYTQGRSSVPFNKNNYVIPKDIPVAIQDSVKGAAPKSVFGPVLVGNAYKLYKMVDARRGGAVNADLRHILIAVKDTTPAAQAEALAKATEVRGKATVENFGAVVAESSDDMQSKMNGGSIGWYSGGGFYGADFDNAIKGAAKGSIVGPIKTKQGYEIVHVADKSDESYLLAEVEREISVGSETNDKLYTAINDFAAKAQAKKDIEVAGKEAGIVVRTSQPLGNNAKNLSGLPARNVILWAATAKEGEFSPVQDVDRSAFVFAQVYKKRSEGVQDLEDVRAAVTREVLNEKKAKMIKEKLDKVANGTDLNKIKDAYGAGAFVSTAADVTFETPSISGIGNDPIIVGKIAGAKANSTSKPIVGKNGVYVVQVSAITEAPAKDAKAIEEAQKGNAQALQGVIRQKIEQALIKQADAKDERYKANF